MKESAMKDKSKRIDHSGSSFDEFLREEGMLEEAEAVAIKRVSHDNCAVKCSGSASLTRG
jgi:hypothetical protein